MPEGDEGGRCLGCRRGMSVTELEGVKTELEVIQDFNGMQVETVLQPAACGSNALCLMVVCPIVVCDDVKLV